MSSQTSLRKRIHDEDSLEDVKKKCGRFVWRKKIERDLALGVPLSAFSNKAEKQRQRERKAEIEKIRNMRQERALERERRQQELAFSDRKRAQAEFEHLQAKEDMFVFEQCKAKSLTRLRQGRAKPIDVLSGIFYSSEDVTVPRLREPHAVFKGLTVEELESLSDDIKMHLAMDRSNPKRVQYWEALMVVCNWELAQVKRIDGAAEEKGPNISCVEVEVNSNLQEKNCSELETLQSQIEMKMKTGEAKVVEFWETVLNRIHLYKARACLKDMVSEMSRKDSADESKTTDNSRAADDLGTSLNDPEEDVGLETESHGELQLRKPKYSVRVRSGYDWNKYNQTHYDHDNPPPKTVRGYMFNIFYPDLVDKTKAPVYTIEKDESNDEMCIIRFHAGPPYEDLGFQIPNKEWEYSKKRGFKCTFQSGVLLLDFNFKHFRYRR